MWRQRWTRRALVWPPILLGTPLLVALAPLLFVIAVATDVVTGPRRMRATRLLGLGLTYVVLEWIGLAIAAVLWVATVFGLLMQRPWSRRAHYAVQRWWASTLFRSVCGWFGARVHIEGEELVGDPPVVIAARHASFFDALVPSVVLRRHPVLARHVLKRELTWDPCLDVYGNRHPNHFVTRGALDRGSELAAIEKLAREGGDEALVIFPEGTFRSATRAARVMDRFGAREPARAARLHLRHLLPARPGGIQALMRGCPEADLVVIGHVGFEPFGSMRAILANVPFSDPVEIRAWRIPSASLPADDEGRLRVIDTWWQTMDDWIEEIASHRREVHP